YPLPYAGGELPETNIGLMPGLVSTYDQGLRWKNQPVGKALTDFLADKGIVILTWVWQAGGVASRTKPIVSPEDAKGLKVRGGSREMDMVLQTAGAAVLSVPSNELYAAMQTGACDAGITSSTSLISFRLEEVAKCLTSGADASYWFMMHGPITDQVEVKAPATSNPLVAGLGRVLDFCNRIIVILAGIALVAACLILSYSVLGRALFKSPNYWQDEAAVFLLVGATFM